ncbi:hypothetical protein N7467_003633 [Penicillium canescens]|nr:hypothetical protein N7467_003633 [Penicillium canescens]
MAPLTRSARTASSGGNLFSQALPPPRQNEIISVEEEEDQSGSFDENEGSEGEEPTSEDQDEDMDEDMDGVNDEESETGSEESEPEPALQSVYEIPGKGQDTPLFTAAGAQEALHPLRRTADRVTRQIEAFADKLDQFKRKNTTDDFQNVQAAYKLVESYRDLAKNAIKEIQTQQITNRHRASYRASDVKSHEQIQRLQLEVDTWRLLLNLISIDDPASRASFKEGRQTAFQNLHRYSSDREIWEEFLNADQYGLECVVAMRWLEETSKTSTQDFDDLIAQMEARSERGQGLWSHGWLYTKEAIKGHKRLRAWPQPLEPNDPGIARSLLSTEEQKPLVTQLDPDALTRQKHGLEKQDEIYERATWVTCWKMLRQGENWTKIREWAEGRLEGWRAVSLCGSSVDDNAPKTRFPIDDGHTRLMNSRAHDSWRTACAALTRSPNTDDFQRAVYSLLSGETDAASSVCRSWDDHLYVYFNSVVLQRYRGFCTQFQRKLSLSPSTPVSFTPEAPGHADLQKFLVYLRGVERVSGEARNPFRNIQAAILSKGYDSFFPALAQAVSQLSADKYGKASIVPELAHSPVDESFLIAADDEEALRIATHTYIVASSMTYARADTHFFEQASVIIAGYIATLEEKCLFDLIPLYVSLLPTEMANSVFSKILIEIIDPEEKMQQVRLMRRYGIDVEAVLEVQWSWLSADVPTIDHSRDVTGYSRVVRRPDGLRALVSPKTDLIGTSVADEDEKMIRSLEWFRAVDGQWDKICELGAWLYRKFFVADKLAAARELSLRMRLSDISIEKFGSDIISIPPQENPVEASTPTSPSKSKRNSLHRRSTSNSSNFGLVAAWYQCQRMSDLEVLTLGFDTVEQFAQIHEQISKTRRRRDSGAVTDMTDEMHDCVTAMEDYLGAVVSDDWLVTSTDADEEKDYDKIRTTYLPELVLDYHNAMHYASHCLERHDLLTQCMIVSVWVANFKHLTDAFTKSRRMAELVDALALSSKAMVNRNLEFQLSNKKKDHHFEKGQELKIWDVEIPQKEGETRLHNLPEM